jgi:hypothetical protein
MLLSSFFVTGQEYVRTELHEKIFRPCKFAGSGIIAPPTVRVIEKSFSEANLPKKEVLPCESIQTTPIAASQENIPKYISRSNASSVSVVGEYEGVSVSSVIPDPLDSSVRAKAYFFESRKASMSN